MQIESLRMSWNILERRDSKVVDVDYEVAVKNAELRSGQQIPMADSVIAATAQIQDCTLFSDDALFRAILISRRNNALQLDSVSSPS